MMLLLSVSFSYTHAWDDYKKYDKKEPTKMEDREVIYWNHGLELKLENWEVIASWNEFPSNAWFDWFKLVYSTSNSQPVYPNDKTVFVGSRMQTETSFKLDDGWEHFIRLCVVVLNDDYSKDRYCGDVQTFEKEYIADEEKKYNEEKKVEKKYYEKEREMKVCTMEYAPVCGKKDGKYKMYSNNCMREAADAYKVEEKYCTGENEYEEKTESTFGLSLTLRLKINEVLEDFIERLEDKNYSDEKISDSIDIVLERLEALAKKSKYKNIAGYMMQELTAMQEKYSDPLWEFESIFEGL